MFLLPTLGVNGVVLCVCTCVKECERKRPLINIWSVSFACARGQSEQEQSAADGYLISFFRVCL